MEGMIDSSVIVSDGPDGSEALRWGSIFYANPQWEHLPNMPNVLNTTNMTGHMTVRTK